jgi:folate-dependent phosphoribosylglycinamide formyltransferase PurN
MNYSIVWKLRPGGLVTFRHELTDMPSLAAALEAFRRAEPEAYLVQAYAHQPIDPVLLAGLMDTLEQKIVADGWRSLGD